MVGERFKAWREQLRADVRAIGDTVRSRIEYGDPPLLNPSEDLGVSPRLSLDAKRQRIRRRRAFLGLDFREAVEGPGRR